MVITIKDLNRWERYYLLRSHGLPFVTLRYGSKAIDSLLDKGLIRGTGMRWGRIVEFPKNPLAVQIIYNYFQL